MALRVNIAFVFAVVVALGLICTASGDPVPAADPGYGQGYGHGGHGGHGYGGHGYGHGGHHGGGGYYPYGGYHGGHGGHGHHHHHHW